jgi:hypothetical protein
MGLKKAYLIAYNAASAAAWGVVLVQVILIGSTQGPVAVGNALGEYARITQTFAIMEILHSVTGLSAPLPPRALRGRPPGRRLTMIHIANHPRLSLKVSSPPPFSLPRCKSLAA